MFDVCDEVINRDHLMEPFYEMQQTFVGHGDELHTIDVYESLEVIDYFLFFEHNWELVSKLRKIGKSDRMIYCNAEPPSVNRLNSPKGYSVLKYVFPYILTWNDDWIDNKSIFKKNIPYPFVDEREGMLSFEKRKLVTFISGNKKSDYPGELYSERERAVEYFENRCPEDFDFYGTGWNSEAHPCYKGVAACKSDIYHRFKFVICYENIRGYKGYVTEKILDCITSGAVPIYCGADNIEEYIPRDCYILKDEFSNYEELYGYIRKISKEKYEDYLKAADEYISSEKIRAFGGAEYADSVYRAIKFKKRFVSNVIAKRIYKNIR